MVKRSRRWLAREIATYDGGDGGRVRDRIAPSAPSRTAAKLRERYVREIARLESEVARSEKKLANESFVAQGVGRGGRAPSAPSSTTTGASCGATVRGGARRTERQLRPTAAGQLARSRDDDLEFGGDEARRSILKVCPTLGFLPSRCTTTTGRSRSGARRCAAGHRGAAGVHEADRAGGRRRAARGVCLSAAATPGARLRALQTRAGCWNLASGSARASWATGVRARASNITAPMIGTTNESGSCPAPDVPWPRWAWCAVQAWTRTHVDEAV